MRQSEVGDACVGPESLLLILLEILIHFLKIYRGRSGQIAQLQKQIGYKSISKMRPG